MRVHLLRGLYVFALLFFVAASSGEVTSGTVQSIDPNNKTLTLQDGGVYGLPADFSDPGIKTGDKVEIRWRIEDGKSVATAVTVVQ
jgi:Cu/Ag efflux protein CusF